MNTTVNCTESGADSLAYGRLCLNATADEVEYKSEYAVLFPFFVMSVGVFVFYCLQRFRVPFPYPACMFVLGVAMGAAVMLIKTWDDQLALSILMWSKIDPNLLLMVFLPGLLFREAIEFNMNRFYLSLWQILTLAYPMVLLGTVLNSLVAKYVFPDSYGFTWYPALALGAVLSSTDPAAVAGILKELGAPPRLGILLGGESLLNDGSSVR